MESIRNSYEPQHSAETLVAIPASELLQNPAQAAAAWPEISAADPRFLDQIAEHGARAQCIAEVMELVPDPTMSLEMAAKRHFITERQTEQLYKSLGDLLADEDYTRLVLYVPFEFLPSPSWAPKDAKLASALETFRQSYRAAWHSQLSVYDVRANFVDGDVLETELRTEDVPRVVKAAHLIPGLVRCGMLTMQEVTELFAATEDPLLKSNIADSLLVLAEMNRANENVTADDKHAVSHTISSIRSELAAISTAPIRGVENNTTERRLEWLKQKQTDEAIAKLAERVGLVVLEDADSETIVHVLLNENASAADQVLVAGIQTAVEQATIVDGKDPQALFDTLNPTLLSLWHKGGVETRARLATTYRRLYRLGVVDERQLDSLNIKLTTLGGPFSENLALMPEEVGQLKDIATSIEADSELSALIYPMLAVGGSRLKGYGTQGSDLDISIFIRPGTPQAMIGRIRELMGAQFEQHGQSEEPMELWLDRDKSGLNVRDVPGGFRESDHFSTHLLFGTAWIGDAKAISELHQKLLSGYFYETNEYVYGRCERALYLERIEQDVLQYRLMHKGYARHYPRRMVMDLPHADLIDGTSTFWDPGYRRLATQLFMKMVFLPKLS